MLVNHSVELPLDSDPESVALTIRSSLALVVAVLLVLGITASLRRRRSGSRRLLLVSAGFFVIVAMSHVFEAFRILPAVGWGQPRSPGHFIDLAAALAGVTCLLAATVAVLVRPSPK